MHDPLSLIKQIQALTEHGQHYAHNEFDLSRYKEIESLCFDLIESLYQIQPTRSKTIMSEYDGYKTPKVDIRAVVFNADHAILLVKERIDGLWSLPGGWADIGYTPSEVAVKETQEEAGIEVEAGKLLGILDKKCHDHPKDLFYIYKVFIECHYVGEIESDFLETTDAGFFKKSDLPPLSTPRNTEAQLNWLFSYHAGESAFPLVD